MSVKCLVGQVAFGQVGVGQTVVGQVGVGQMAVGQLSANWWKSSINWLIINSNIKLNIKNKIIN